MQKAQILRGMVIDGLDFNRSMKNKILVQNSNSDLCLFIVGLLNPAESSNLSPLSRIKKNRFAEVVRLGLTPYGNAIHCAKSNLSLHELLNRYNAGKDITVELAQLQASIATETKHKKDRPKRRIKICEL